MNSDLKTYCQGLQAEMSACRRDIHSHPEQGFCEYRTAALVAKQLTALGYTVYTGEDAMAASARMGVPDAAILQAAEERAIREGGEKDMAGRMAGGMTAVVGVLDCGPGPCVALRFDMDALPILESRAETHVPSRLNFFSIHDGTMHACGHDAHVTIGLYVARMLSERRESLHGRVIFLFQPAEEGVRGARAMVEKGWLDHVDYLIGGHVEPSADGRLAVSPGTGDTFATTKLDAVFHGAPAHAGAMPEGGANCILAIATAITNLYAIPRHSGGASRVNVGRVEAGEGRNVIASGGKLLIEVRGATTAVNEYMEQRAIRVLEAAAEMYGCTVTVTKAGSAPCMENSPELTALLNGVADANGFLRQEPYSMGASEDFACMAQRVIACGGQSCFTGLHTPMPAAAHTAEFDLDERILPEAVAFYTTAVETLLSGNLKG